MRRKPDRLVPLERDICVAAFHLSSRGIDEFHGYQLAKILKDGESHRLLTAYSPSPPPPPRRGQSRR